MNRLANVSVCLCAIVAAACLAAEARATNLISNGNFSAGNTGFTSQYSYNTITNHSGPWVFGPELVEGAYSVVTEASDVHFAWGDYFDHTSEDASGKYLVANASSDTSKTVWQSNIITVSQANTAYRFEAWLTMIYPLEDNPPQLAFEIGDGTSWTSLGETPAFNLEEDGAGTWKFAYADGQFANAGIYYVRLKNANGASGGNDLGLDDIYFGLRSAAPSVGEVPGTTPAAFNPVAVPEPSGLALALTGVLVAASWRVLQGRKRA